MFEHLSSSQPQQLLFNKVGSTKQQQFAPHVLFSISISGTTAHPLP
jgi:hypothetical protein